ncbi:MAG: hypothetical protein P4L55_14365 [Syntrophobacteraceae bacterium]|nr:hypothetical protein [Syntrophobacteraceae bacterium]
MRPDVLFEKFPDIVLSSFRKQMLLGIVPADTVERILEPLLSNFQELMLRLPPALQTDFENILRLYPDVAERFSVFIKPPVVESLRSFAGYRQKKHPADKSEPEEKLDLAAEHQDKMEVRKKSFEHPLVKEGQGFFTTDRGNPVYLEFSCPEGGDSACFEYLPARMDIEIHLCGNYTITLTAQAPKREIPVESLSQILMKCGPEVEITIIEKS